MSAPETSPTAADTLDSPEAGGRYIRGSLLRLASFGVSLLVSLASAPLVIRHLGSAQYGYFASVTALIFIIGGFTEAGLNTLGIREYAAGGPGRMTLLRNLVGLRVSATLVAVLAVAAISALAGSPSVVYYGLLVAGGGLIATIAAENYGIPLSADLRLGAVSALDLARQLALAIAYVALVLAGARVLPFLAATALSGAVMLGGTWLLVRGSVSLRPAFDWSVWRSLIARTLPYAVATAVGIVYFREALVLSSYISSERQTSYYSAAFRIVEVLTVIPWQLIASGFPILSRAAHLDDYGRLSYAMQRLFEVAAIVGVWMALSVVFGAPFGIHVVAGHGFSPSIPVLRIQGLALITSFVVALFGSLLLSLRLYRKLLLANLVAVAVASALSAILIPRYGAQGAAVAPTAAEASLAIAYAHGLLRARPELKLSLRFLPRVLGPLAVAGGVTLAVPIPSAAKIALFGVLYFAGLGLTRAVPAEILGAVLRRRPPVA